MRITRRLPLPVRPWFLGAGLVLTLLGVTLGLNLESDVSLFTGNVLVQLAVTESLLVWSIDATAWFAVAVVGLALVAWSLVRPPTSVVFYPLSTLLGLFVAVFGIVYLFQVAVSGERTATGSVAFVFFEYAGLLQRPVQSVFGLVLLGAGVFVLGRFTLGRAPGSRPRRVPEPAPATPAAAPLKT